MAKLAPMMPTLMAQRPSIRGVDAMDDLHATDATKGSATVGMSIATRRVEGKTGQRQSGGQRRPCKMIQLRNRSFCEPRCGSIRRVRPSPLFRNRPARNRGLAPAPACMIIIQYRSRGPLCQVTNRALQEAAQRASEPTVGGFHPTVHSGASLRLDGGETRSSGGLAVGAERKRNTLAAITEPRDMLCAGKECDV